MSGLRSFWFESPFHSSWSSWTMIIPNRYWMALSYSIINHQFLLKLDWGRRRARSRRGIGRPAPGAPEGSKTVIIVVVVVVVVVELSQGAWEGCPKWKCRVRSKDQRSLTCSLLGAAAPPNLERSMCWMVGEHAKPVATSESKTIGSGNDSATGHKEY